MRISHDQVGDRPQRTKPAKLGRTQSWGEPGPDDKKKGVTTYVKKRTKGEWLRKFPNRGVWKKQKAGILGIKSTKAKRHCCKKDENSSPTWGGEAISPETINSAKECAPRKAHQKKKTERGGKTKETGGTSGVAGGSKSERNTEHGLV